MSTKEHRWQTSSKQTYCRSTGHIHLSGTPGVVVAVQEKMIQAGTTLLPANWHNSLDGDCLGVSSWEPKRAPHKNPRHEARPSKKSWRVNSDEPSLLGEWVSGLGGNGCPFKLVGPQISPELRHSNLQIQHQAFRLRFVCMKRYLLSS